MHKLLDDLSLWDAHIKYRISFMSVYSELYCAKFDICSFIVNNSSVDIHSRHIRLIIPLNHTQKLPSISFVKTCMICNQIDRSNSF